MKTLKYIGLTALAIVLVAAAIGFAETARFGGNAYNFNPTKIVQKTANYTVTTSDSQVDVTASSANIVITLPTVASCQAGQICSFKITKKDATAYKIIVTPASGDTIGYESTRYLIGDESYVVTHAGPGRNWTVNFESPYLVEDHEAGTYTTGIGSGGLYTTSTTSRTLTASECGNIISMATGTTVFTLPATVANCELTFVNAVAGPNATMTIDPNASDKIMGGVTLATTTVTIAGADGAYVINTGGTTVKGDWITLVGDGVDGWFIIGSKGIFAAE